MGKKIFVPVGNVTRLQRVHLDTCTRCAACAEYCPVYVEVKEREVLPGWRAHFMVELVKKQKGPLRALTGPKPVDEEEFEKGAVDVYRCTLCGRCGEICTFGFDTHTLWTTLRSIIHRVDKHPPVLKQLDELIVKTMNPYGMDPETRSDWVGYVGLEEAPVKDRAEVAYFVGCTSAFKAVGQDVLYAASLILNKAKEDWTLLGNREWCCGSPSLMTGNEEKAAEFAKHNTEVIESIGARKVVTSCAGCYRVFRWEYPQLIGRRPRFEVVHIVELLNQYIRSRRLKVEEKNDAKVTYHDPCELSRLGGLVEEPRYILRHAAPTFVELPENRLNARCCGGGGLLQAVDEKVRLQIAQKRIKQAETVGADILTSGCPACKMTLTDAVGSLQSNVKVLDIVEFVARQVGLI